MIDKVDLENFRCFGPSLEVPLRQLNVLAGPNDSGKSAFLDAFLFFQDCETSSSFHSASSRGGYAEIIWKGLDTADRRCSVQIHDSTGARKQGFVIGPDDEKKATIGRAIPRSEQCLVVESFRPVPSRIVAPSWPHHKAYIDYDGYGLPSALEYLATRYPERCAEIEAIVRTAYPTILGIAFEDDFGMNRVRQRHRLLFRREHDRTFLRVEDAPDGLLVFLAYVTRRFLDPAPDVLLLENPENSLHHSHLAVFVAQLQAMSVPGRDFWQDPPQVFITTHSPYFLDHFALDDLLLCYRPAPSAPAVVQPVPADPAWRASLEEYTVGEAVTFLGERQMARGGQKEVDNGQ